MTYTKEDCIRDTTEHINQVRENLSKVIAELEKRKKEHDLSKLQSPEVEVFTEYIPKLRDSTYGSEEYKKNLEGLKIALNHHYAHNSHHPEHYEDGIRGMDLLKCFVIGK